jgi:hypothetical protein
MINAVMATWSPGGKFDFDRVEEYLNCKLNEKTSRYIHRVKMVIAAAERADPQFVGQLFYFSEIARSIEDARAEARQTPGDTEEAGPEGRCWCAG